MYPAALHKTPTQAIDWSQVFERWFFQKQPKTKNKKTKSWGRKTIKHLEQVCPKKDHDFISWLLSLKTILPGLNLSSWSIIQFKNSFTQKCLSEKRLNQFESFVCVDTENKIHNAIRTTSNAALSTDQAPLPSTLHNEVWSRIGHFSICSRINKISIFEVALMINFSHLFIH